MKRIRTLGVKKSVWPICYMGITILILMVGLSTKAQSAYQSPGWDQLNASASKNDIRMQVLLRIKNYLIKDPVLLQQLEWSSDAISIFRSEGARDSGIVETKIYWNEIEKYGRLFSGTSPVEAYLQKSQSRLMKDLEIPEKPAKPEQTQKEMPLQGFRIALDPGHVGGTMDFGRLEKKFVRIKKGNRPEITQTISFNEGNLALATALILRDSLEKLGADVLITREKEGHTAFDVSFREWCEQKADSVEALLGIRWSSEQKTKDGYPARWRNGVAWSYVHQENITGKDSLWWMTEATMRDIYRIPFLKADFKQRANEINNFNPHFTFVIHYNIWEKNTWNSGKYLNAIDDNFGMAFVPGSFMAGELKKPEHRMAFLRKACSDDIPESIKLSEAVIEGYSKYLEVPIIPYDTSLRYLRAASLPTEAEGVFARNLSLTRLIDGPICFGEALYQDNVDECRRLNKKTLKLPGMTTLVPLRLIDAVNAYLHGALVYAKEY